MELSDNVVAIMCVCVVQTGSVQTRLFYLKVSRNGNYAKRRLGLLLPMDLLEILADYSAKLGSTAIPLDTRDQCNLISVWPRQCFTCKDKVNYKIKFI